MAKVLPRILPSSESLFLVCRCCPFRIYVPSLMLRDCSALTILFALEVAQCVALVLAVPWNLRSRLAGPELWSRLGLAAVRKGKP